VAVVVGWAIIALSGVALLVTVFGLRARLSPTEVDAATGIAGGVLAIGGLLTLHDVEAGSWVVAPAGVAALAVFHVRALFAGAGPFRT
jgi:hypothetical protein